MIKNRIHKICPEGFVAPYAHYYEILNWKGEILSKYDLVSFDTLGDNNNCLLHAIMNSCYITYRQGNEEGREISRNELAVKLRKEISEELFQKDTQGRSLWSKLCDGKIKEMSELGYKDYSLQKFKELYDSNQPLGDGSFHLLGHLLNINIFIFDSEKEKLMDIHEYKYSIVKHRKKNILISYENGHYELMGIMIDENDFKFVTNFDYDSDIIKDVISLMDCEPFDYEK